MKALAILLAIPGCTAVHYATGVDEATQACVVQKLMERNEPEMAVAYKEDLAELGLVCPT